MIDIIQIVIIVGIIVIFGTLITFINLKKKNVAPVRKEQSSWQKIEELNSRKKEFLKKKEELSFKYSAKSISDDEYNNALKFITSELKKIDLEINTQVSKLSSLQKNQDGSNDLRFENIKLKGKLNELQLEKENKDARVKELEEFIKNVGTNQSDLPACETSKNKYYGIIIEKYKDVINDVEQKTISEIKSMIQPGNLSINSLVAKHKPIGYDYGKDYLPTLKTIYNYFKSEITVVKNNLKVLFWLDFNTILKEKIADEQDISILLCSVMKALEDNNVYIYVVLLEEDKTHAFVKTKYKNTHYIFDLTQKVPFDTFKNIDEEELFKNYHFLNKKIVKKIYRYNTNDYEDF